MAASHQNHLPRGDPEDCDDWKSKVNSGKDPSAPVHLTGVAKESRYYLIITKHGSITTFMDMCDPEY